MCDFNIWIALPFVSKAAARIPKINAINGKKFPRRQKNKERKNATCLAKLLETDIKAEAAIDNKNQTVLPVNEKIIREQM